MQKIDELLLNIQSIQNTCNDIFTVFFNITVFQIPNNSKLGNSVADFGNGCWGNMGCDGEHCCVDASDGQM